MSEGQRFTVGGSVSVNALYVPRQADRELLGLCRAGEYAFILSSRQVGKSSLMLRTAQTLRAEGFQCVTFSLEYLGKETTSAEQFYHGILHELQKQLQFQTNPRTWWQARAHLSFAQRFSHFLGEVLLQEVTDPIIVFIDEIDTTLGVPYSDDFFAAVRALYNARAEHPEYRRLSFVLIGVATPTDLIKDQTRTPFNVGKRVEVTDFIKSEAMELIKGFDFPEAHARQILQWILKWTKGHPYLTQRFCRAVAEDERTQWSEREVDELAAGLFMGRNSRDDSNLDFVQKGVLRYERDDKRRDMHLQMMQTYKDVLTSRRPIPDEEKSPIKSELKLTGIIQRQNGHLIVRNQIYQSVFDRKWIDEHWPAKFWTPGMQRRMKYALWTSIAVGLILLGANLLQARRQVTVERGLRAEADTLRTHAEKERDRATHAEGEAKVERDRAEREEEKARAANAKLVEQTNLALLLKKIAELRRVSADSAREVAEARRRQVELLNRGFAARSLGLIAPNFQQQRADTLGLLLARQAYAFNEDSPEKFDNEVYHALRRSLNASSFSKSRLLGGPDTLRGHKDWARYVTISPDGRMLASGSADSTIWLWNFSDAQHNKLDILSGHRGSVRAVAFSPDSRTLVSGGDDQTIRLWNMQDKKGSVLAAKAHSDWIWSVRFSPDGKTLASAGGDSAVRIWSLESRREPLHVFRGHEGSVRAVAFSPNGETLASCGTDEIICLWRWRATGNGANSAALVLHDTSVVRAIVFSPSGDTLISASDDGKVRLWFLTRPEQKPLDLLGHEGRANSVALSRDGRILASGGADRSVRLWDLQALERNPIVLLEHDSWVWSVAFSPRGDFVVSGSSDKTVRIWASRTVMLAQRACANLRRDLTTKEWKEFVARNLPYEKNPCR